MRVATVRGRLSILTPAGAVDVNRTSAGLFDPDPQSVYARWDEFVAWCDTADFASGEPYDRADLGPPVPRPGQIIAVGLNYRDHARESGLDVPERPTVFTKFASCLTGPYGDIRIPLDGHTDWEVELVAVVGRTTHRVAESDAWSHIAGLTVGQDLSERIMQLDGPAPQFSLGKSYPGFGPIGPCVVTTDDFDNPEDLELRCTLNGELVQLGHTRDLVFPLARLVSILSRTLTLWPGDLIFTGTPAGVGMGRSPQRWLRAGDELVSHITGIGELRHRILT
ncbi:fumarylacetoacetate hydrolase family protein [Nocardia brevicatena]|uniref:fumarylacetoacetate hydrolase family protein n=1 Tax=Nocardia brevicatena TaxID=37327 RepID=UPI0002FDD57A|nr:fumarylacetoacetate hydrolase family protein [Nocardia brevicatena]